MVLASVCYGVLLVNDRCRSCVVRRLLMCVDVCCCFVMFAVAWCCLVCGLFGDVASYCWRCVCCLCVVCVLRALFVCGLCVVRCCVFVVVCL